MGTGHYIICDKCKEYFDAGKDSELSQSWRMTFDMLQFMYLHSGLEPPSYSPCGIRVEEDGSFVGDDVWRRYKGIMRTDAGKWVETDLWKKLEGK